MALLFTVAGLIGVVITLAAWRSRPYRRLVEAESAPPVEVATA
jgi:hypothetical protein